jgi:hypothetical protein
MSIDAYIAVQTETLQPLLRSVLQTIRAAMPEDVAELIF